MARNKLKRQVNTLKQQLKTLRIDKMTINELISSADVKAESFDITAIENGFSLKFAYRLKKNTKKADDEDYWNWDYKSKVYFFATWEELVKFIGDNALPQPPK